MPRTVFAAALAWLTLCAASLADGLTAKQAAERVDTLLTKELSGAVASESPAMSVASDEVFLRRASFDLVGHPASPSQITQFVAESNPDKRAIVVDLLLKSPEFGVNWGRYWRDAILSRRTEPRAEMTGPVLVKYIAERFNADDGWDQIAEEMITATGSIRENGATAIIMAQSGNAEEIAAEVARLFLGVQIQCAQCHDHPTDRWKRQQFHELAAFFARVETRQVRDSKVPLDYEVVGRDRGRVYVPPKPDGKNRSLEHFMPDLEDPKAQGTIVQPALFLTDQRIDTGKTDAVRRDVLAVWTTDEKNPWFAKAFVNRVWTELVGWGFYEPVDDLGPDRECRAPKTLDFLAAQFVKHDYQVKWLYRTIVATNAYQRAPGDAKTSPLLVSHATRLRSDQFYDALTMALGVKDLQFDFGPRRGPGARLRGPRYILSEEFDFDPSDPRGDQAGSIPQSLILMNAKGVQQSIDGGDAKTALGKLLADTTDDAEVTRQLYLRALGRQPTEKEQATCLAHVKTAKSRNAAFEDVLWALVNSTEMLVRR
jgi:hypothetical protein